MNLIKAMKSRALQIRNVAFYVTLPSFFLVLVVLLGTSSAGGIPSIPLALAGMAVVLATFWLKESIVHKVFFILAGGSGTALAITLIVADSMSLLGCPSGGGDGGGIFLPMILICPPLFIIGALGGIVFHIKESVDKDMNTP
jgi:hypothetical protein